MSWGENTYEIRYKNGKKFRSSFVKAKDPSQAVRRAKINGRILSVQKVSIEDMLSIGDKYVRNMLLPDPNLFRLEQLFGTKGGSHEVKDK